MLLRLGIASALYNERRPAGVRRLPDGRGGSADYATEAQHELVVAGETFFDSRNWSALPIATSAPV